MIPVTKPFLPPQSEYEHFLSKVWETHWLTNMGPLASELEVRIKTHLAVENLLFVTNGTIALQMAIKALGLKGEVVTTPFSFIATTSSLVWEGCTPVFVDIDKNSLNIDPVKIEAAITDKTCAVLATHVYGNPCDVEAIQAIADKHGIKVIYDAAHAFGVQLNGKSIFEYGDISICSLHATKLYHSGEGGLLITTDTNLSKKLAYMRNFGFDGPEAFAELGINGKNSEFHAAMGLANFKYIESIHQKRRDLSKLYREKLAWKVSFPEWHSQATENYAYFPVLFEAENQLLECLKRFEADNIQARRYFYPSLAKVLPYLRHKEMPVTEDIARRILCLPLYFDLSMDEVETISNLILKD